MNDCNSPYIVGYYGCFPADVHVGVVMEYMDAGSLDSIYRRNGAIPVQIVGKVAEAVLKGLMYLYDVHRIIHRGELCGLCNLASLTAVYLHITDAKHQTSNRRISSPIPLARSRFAILVYRAS